MIEAAEVSVRFRTGLLRRPIRALDSFSLKVEEGDFFALLGQNGAGKSTAMHCFLGLIRPSSGRVKVLGNTPCPGHELFDEVAYLPEEPHYHGYLTVEEAVTFYGSLHRTPVGARAVSEAIDSVGLTPHRKLRVSRCSKGMKQKVGIAHCLLKRPRLMLLDEPTRGLDPLMVRQLRETLMDLNASGTTILMNSHVLAETEMVARRVAIIDRGKVVRQGTLEELLRPDQQIYEVEAEAPEGRDPAWPEYFAPGPTKDGVAAGTIPEDRLHHFVSHCQQSGARVLSCALRRLSLEDVYVSTVKGE
jgi:ABC-2 type transport system ATP-binding protein